MNRKGFTLVELVILGIVVGLAITGISINMKNAKKKAEAAFVKTLTDAVKVYIDDSAAMKDVVWNETGKKCNKELGDSKLYEARKTFDDIIESDYHPLTEADLKNSASGKTCSKDMIINIYKDDDEVYYYSILLEPPLDEQSVHTLSECLLDTKDYDEVTGKILSNLPETCHD